MTELAEPFAMSQPAISKHLKVLERAGLISLAEATRRHLRPGPRHCTWTPGTARSSASVT